MKFPISNFQFPKSPSRESGIASLGITIILGVIIIEIALAVALLVYFLNFSNLGVRLSAEALSIAQAGIEDGLMRVIRKDIPNGEYYLFPPGAPGANAKIDIFQVRAGTDCSSDPKKICITSEGTSGIFGKKRKLEAIVQSQDFLPVSIESIREITL